MQNLKEPVDINLYGYKCKVISLEDLIQIKESMTRPKDKETLEYLKQIQRMKKN